MGLTTRVCRCGYEMTKKEEKVKCSHSMDGEREIEETERKSKKRVLGESLSHIMLPQLPILVDVIYCYVSSGLASCMINKCPLGMRIPSIKLKL